MGPLFFSRVKGDVCETMDGDNLPIHVLVYVLERQFMVRRKLGFSSGRISVRPTHLKIPGGPKMAFAGLSRRALNGSWSCYYFVKFITDAFGSSSCTSWSYFVSSAPRATVHTVNT